MSRVMDMLAKRALGNGNTNAETSDGQLPPFILKLLQGFGITPESIRQIAEDFRAAVVGELQKIHGKLETIEGMTVEYGKRLDAIQHELAHKDTEAIPLDLFPKDASAPVEFVSVAFKDAPPEAEYETQAGNVTGG